VPDFDSKRDSRDGADGAKITPTMGARKGFQRWFWAVLLGYPGIIHYVHLQGTFVPAVLSSESSHTVNLVQGMTLGAALCLTVA
jgi:hypothetical protein